jgi:uncharacterized membrane protein
VPPETGMHLAARSRMQRVEKSIRVKAPASQVYEFWRNFENFPRFMDNVEDVRCMDTTCSRSHWKLRGPMGMTVEYDAELTTDNRNQSIGWNARGGAINTSGTATFLEQPDGMTLVHVLMQWADTPGGPIGEAASHMLQNPYEMLEEDLQRFKDIAEGRVGSGLRR